MIRQSSFAFFWLFLATLSGGASAQFKDYSGKGVEYSILKGIGLDVLRIESTGVKQISVEGLVLDVSTFKIVTTEPVTFEEGPTQNSNVIKDLDLHYEMLVGNDRQNLIHNKLIGLLKEISNLPPADRDFSGVGLNGEKGSYLIYSGPPSMPNYVWFDGRVVVVKFVGITERRRDRAFTTETFWKRKIRLFTAGKRLRPSDVSKSFAAEFLKRHAAGEFDRPER